MVLLPCMLIRQTPVSSIDFPRFVDSRRFGRWRMGSWDSSRSPDPRVEFEDFCEHMLDLFRQPSALRSVKALPIGEALLKQEYFNGIGNYLRAEILYRANIHVSHSVRPIEGCSDDAVAFGEDVRCASGERASPERFTQTQSH